MYKASTILKFISIILGGFPFLLLSFFLLIGGPDPGGGGVAQTRLLGWILLVGVFIFALPNRMILRSIALVSLYIIFSRAFGEMFYVRLISVCSRKCFR